MKQEEAESVYLLKTIYISMSENIYPFLYSKCLNPFSNIDHYPNSVYGVIYRPNTQRKADVDFFTNNLFEILDKINSERKIYYFWRL